MTRQTGRRGWHRASRVLPWAGTPTPSQPGAGDADCSTTGPGATSLRLAGRPSAGPGPSLATDSRTGPARGRGAWAARSTPPPPPPAAAPPAAPPHTQASARPCGEDGPSARPGCPRAGCPVVAGWLEADPGPGETPPPGQRWPAGGPAHSGCPGSRPSWLGVWRLPCPGQGALRNTTPPPFSLCLGGRGPLFPRPPCFLGVGGLPTASTLAFPQLTHPHAQGPSQPALPHWPDWFAWHSPARTPSPHPHLPWPLLPRLRGERLQPPNRSMVEGGGAQAGGGGSGRGRVEGRRAAGAPGGRATPGCPAGCRAWGRAVLPGAVLARRDAAWPLVKAAARRVPLAGRAAHRG